MDGCRREPESTNVPAPGPGAGGGWLRVRKADQEAPRCLPARARRAALGKKGGAAPATMGRIKPARDTASECNHLESYLAMFTSSHRNEHTLRPAPPLRGIEPSSAQRPKQSSQNSM